MQIDVKLNVDMDNFGKENCVATGWVELDYAIKFPVTIRQYKDKDTGQQRMFVSYPQTKGKDGYSYICYPHDKSVKEQMNAAILEELKKVLVVKKMNTLPVDKVRITRFEKPRESGSKIRTLGVATIQVSGITINGIMIKEGSRGRFIQMPQHLSGGEYRDTVYGMNKSMQQIIKDSILEEYERMEQKQPETRQPEKKQEKPEPAEPQQQKPVIPMHIEEVTRDPVERFLQAAMSEDHKAMAEILKENRAGIRITEKDYYGDGRTIASQEAVMSGASGTLTLVFSNDYDPAKATGEKEVHTEIFAFVPTGGSTRIVTISQTSASHPAEAAENYERMVRGWESLTGSRVQEPVPIRPNARMSQPRL